MKQHQLDISDIDRIDLLIAGGAAWITLTARDATDSEITGALQRAIRACSEAEVILILHGSPDLALATTDTEGRRASGVIVGPGTDPAAVREQLGPHAIIGYDAGSADEIIRLAPLDIDYFTLPTTAMTGVLADVTTPIVASDSPAGLPEGFDGYIEF